MKKVFDSVVFSGADTPKYSSSTFPAMCTLSDGRIFASFKAAPKKDLLTRAKPCFYAFRMILAKHGENPLKSLRHP